MLNWIDYRKALFGRIGEIAKLSPDTVKAYQTMSSAGQKADLLGAKTRELISLAVAVSLRCDGCITVHTAEALGVAVAMNAGATMVYSARTMDAVAAYTAEATQAAAQ
jgi:AhpD family alkylhydroperoxidase